MNKGMKKDYAKMVKKQVELPETGKRSTRSNKEESACNYDKKVSERKETREHKPREIRRGNRFRKRNESKESDLEDKETESDDLRGINSKDEPRTDFVEIVKLPETRKRSARLNAKKSRSPKDKDELNLRENKTQKHESGEIRKGNKLKKKNELKENDVEDKNTESDNLRGINSTEKPKTDTVEIDELPETRKRSARLNANESTSPENKEALNSGENETQKHESGEIGKGNRLKKRNELNKNDVANENAEPDDRQGNNSNDKPKIKQNKFFKSKTPGYDGKPTFLKKINVKNSNKQRKGRESLGYVAVFRQTTLSESFSRGSIRARLRPRKIAKEYKDSSSTSVLLENSIPLENRKSLVLLENINESNLNKKPIYKTVEPIETTMVKDKDSIYDFEFDLNNAEEKPAKNEEKKKAMRKPTRKKKPKLLSKNNNGEPPNKLEQVSKQNVISSDNKKKSTTHKILEPLHAENKNADKNESEILRGEREAAVLTEKLLPAENVEEKNLRVKISNVETLTGDSKVSFKPNLSPSRQSLTKFNPFHSTQSIFKAKSTPNAKEMLDHSLLNKSLSPIKNALEPFDVSSPWRPLLPHSFSRVKQVVQSTPEIKRNFGRTLQGLRIDENNENAEAKATSVINQGVKKALNPLGVRISNAENIQSSNLRNNEPIVNHQETNSSITKFIIGQKPPGLASNFPVKKQSSGFAADRLYKSPNKHEKIRNVLTSRGGGTEDLSSQTKRDSVINEDENSPPKEELKFLKQSNLNQFLNIDEKPESVTINTSHGLFGDAHSTPIIETQTISRIQTQASADNCIEFDDKFSSGLQISPIKFNKKQLPTPGKITFNRLKRRDLSNDKQDAVRISLGEIKNTLYPRKEKKSEKLGRIEKKENNELDFAPHKDAKNQQTGPKLSNDISCSIQFSDTFDIASESELCEGKDKSMGDEIKLFADLEPVHFTKPPRFSYAKKRERKRHWSSDKDNDDEDLEDREEPVLKKRRLVKLNQVEEKKIDEWVKSVNETFQEIEEFDLVVEKLS